MNEATTDLGLNKIRVLYSDTYDFLEVVGITVKTLKDNHVLWIYENENTPRHRAIHEKIESSLVCKAHLPTVGSSA